MGAVNEFSDSDFANQVLKSDVPVLVDFWAPWCGPCRQIAPLIDELAAENSAIKVGKVNIDDNPQTPQKYGVSSIPTLLIFKNGEVTANFVGIQPKAKLQEALDAAAG